MLANFYDYSKMIGEGSFGKVYIGEHRITKKQVTDLKYNPCLENDLLSYGATLRLLVLKLLLLKDMTMQQTIVEMKHAQKDHPFCLLPIYSLD